MPQITNFTTGNEFSSNQSGWPNLTGTITRNFDSYTSDSNAVSPTLAVSSGFATFNLNAAPTKGNTIISGTAATGTGTSLSATVGTTPGANRLVLLCVINQIGSGTATTPTITAGCGLTWTQVTTQTYGVRRITVFRAKGASPTNTAINVDFGGVSQTRIYAWAYDFTNCYAVEATAVAGFASTNSTTSTSVGPVSPTGTTSSSQNYMYFFARAAITGGTPTYQTSSMGSPVSVTADPATGYYSTGNSQGWGDIITAGTANTITWTTSVNNALIGIRLIGADPATSTRGSAVVCSSGTTADTLSYGTIDWGHIHPGSTYVNAGGTVTFYVDATPQLRFYSDSNFNTSPANYYYVLISYTHAGNKSGDVTPENNPGTLLIKLFAVASGSAIELASSGNIADTLTSSGFRPADEQWDMSMNLKKVGTSDVAVGISWKLPPAPGQSSGLQGSFAYGNFAVPANKSYGFTVESVSSVTETTPNYGKVGYLRISDTATVPKQSLLQGVNRSVVW